MEAWGPLDKYPTPFSFPQLSFPVWAQRFKSWSRDPDHAHLGVICHPVLAEVDAFEDCSFVHSKDMREDTKWG